MTVDERTTILEVADILQALGGNNGFGNLQPKVKAMLRCYAVDLKRIVKDDSVETVTDRPVTKEDIEMTY